MNPTAYPGVSLQPLCTLPQSLEKLVNFLQCQPTLTPELACQCVLDASIEPQELLPWADFSHPITDSYGRKLVYDGGYFEIMVMSWVPGDFSAIHDHGAAQWGAVQCFGSAEHYVYELDGNMLRTRAARHYTPGSVKAVDRDLIHQMGNSGKSPFLSLHIYGCENPCGSVTSNARIFELLEESIQYTDGGVFFCLPEETITKRNYGFRGDRETTLRHHQQMRDRIYQILSTPGQASIRLHSKLDQLKEQIALLQR